LSRRREQRRRIEEPGDEVGRIQDVFEHDALQQIADLRRADGLIQEVFDGLLGHRHGCHEIRHDFDDA
jgi:hypothetical protein